MLIGRPVPGTASSTVDVPEGVLIGDGSTHYSMCGRFPGTAERVHRFNPQAKIIYIVRHPIRRIESAWPQLLSVYHANRVLGFDRTLQRPTCSSIQACTGGSSASTAATFPTSRS